MFCLEREITEFISLLNALLTGSATGSVAICSKDVENSVVLAPEAIPITKLRVRS